MLEAGCCCCCSMVAVVGRAGLRSTVVLCTALARALWASFLESIRYHGMACCLRDDGVLQRGTLWKVSSAWCWAASK